MNPNNPATVAEAAPAGRMGVVPMQVPQPVAERLIAALERAAMQCEHVPECHLEGYRERLKAAMDKHCPTRHYTGTPADVDTLVAYLVARQEKP